VTGGAGFVGSHLVDRLIDSDWRVVSVDNLSTGSLGNVNPNAEFHELDIASKEFGSVYDSARPDVVFHLAAQASVAISVREPLRDANENVMGLLNVLEYVRQSPGTRILFASTGGAIYGEPSRLPATETDPCQPISPYAASKLAAEMYLGVYERAYGLDYTVLRLANVYGPRQDPHGEAGVVAIFARAMLANDPVTIFGDGSIERDYAYVSDITEAFATAATAGKSGIYTIGTGIGVSVNEICGGLKQITRTISAITNGPPRPGDISRIYLSAEKAKRELAWEPTVSLEDGLLMTANSFAGGSGVQRGTR
jgi:UDP-glucose 4-epimerase